MGVKRERRKNFAVKIKDTIVVTFKIRLSRTRSNEASSNRSEGLSLLRLLHLIMFFDKFFLHHSPLVRHVRKFGLVVECIAVFFFV